MFGIVVPQVSHADIVVRMLVAVLLCGLIGLEREVSHQPAGLRTHIAVCLGSALFGLISVHGFDAYAQTRADSNYQIDVTRVASQVVVGIGFLGGGAIIKQGAGVRGLTTAASLWVTAAVGLATGIGSFFAAVIATAALLVSLVGLRAPREFIRQRLGRARGTAVIQLHPGEDPSGVVQALFSIPDVKIRNLDVNRRQGRSVINVDMVGPIGSDLAALLNPFLDRDDVSDVEIA